MNILIIDDDKALAKSLQLQLSTQKHRVEITHTGTEGLDKLKKAPFDLLLLDLSLPDKSGLDILASIDLQTQHLKVIVISGREDMNSTIKAIQLGAFDFIRKPLDMDTVLLALEKVKREIKSMPHQVEPSEKAEQTAQDTQREIVGNHPSVLEILKQIGLLSRNKVDVLIQGGSGSGKELIARALHKNECPEAPFIPINCSAIVDTLLESELFGYEKGAFTGANERKKGKFELAQDGIIFFDEIGEMSLNLQAKLLRVLQEREFERVGGTSFIPIRCRAIFATHRNLEQMIQQGEFREDLYYRIAVGKIQIPSLEERKSDIPLLIKHLLEKLNTHYGIGKIQLSSEAISFLQDRPWPGNVRQLENLLLRVASMTPTEFLERSDFLREQQENVHRHDMESNACSDLLTLSLAEMEKQFITQVLTSHAWNITHTAASLKVSPTTLRKKIKDYEIRKHSKHSAETN